MITSKKEYFYYLQEDRRALKISSKIIFINPFEIDLEIWRFQKALRKCEYLYNINKNNPLWKIRKYIAAIKFKKMSLRLGFTIPVNCFGPGLRIAHRGTIVVNGQCKIGTNCTINACVNIGAQFGADNKVPILGDNIFISPGAKVFGDIIIANGCIIGANAVVNKSFLVENTIIIGVPAIAKELRLKANELS